MFELTFLLLRAITVACRRHHGVVLENANLATTHEGLTSAGRAGRPPLDPHVAKLLTDMAGANPLWGAPRIHGELRKPGIEISERTVSRLLAQLSRPPSQP